MSNVLGLVWFNRHLLNVSLKEVRASHMAWWQEIHLSMQKMAGDAVRSVGWEDPQEEEMAPHSSILAWKIPWTEESGRL